jgi:hypothetical protein
LNLVTSPVTHHIYADLFSIQENVEKKDHR